MKYKIFFNDDYPMESKTLIIKEADNYAIDNNFLTIYKTENLNSLDGTLQYETNIFSVHSNYITSIKSIK